MRNCSSPSATRLDNSARTIFGDRNEFLPTVHGFDEFFGNLYHLNAEEEPENPDYPKNAAFKLKFGPRGVFRCTATTADTSGEDPRFGAWGKQKCEDTGPLNKKRMETVDQEFVTPRTISSIAPIGQKKPFFAGSIRAACTSGRGSNRSLREDRPRHLPEAWSSMTVRSDSS